MLVGRRVAANRIYRAFYCHKRAVIGEWRGLATHAIGEAVEAWLSQLGANMARTQL